MLPEKLTLEIVTPERLVLSETVDEVLLPSVEGYMGVRPGHASLLAQLDVGEISYRTDAGERHLAVSGGFAEVLEGGVSILAETAELAEEIDLERAQRSRERAETLLKSQLSGQELLRAGLRLKKAIGRIRVREQAR